MSDLAQTIFIIHNEIKLSQSDIGSKSLQHLPLHKGFVNFENDSEKMKVYVESLEGVSTKFATMSSDLENLKPTFPFLVYPFVVDVVKDECPVQKLIVTQTAYVEAELLDLQKTLLSSHCVSHSLC